MSIPLLSLASLMEPLRGFVAVGRRMSITEAAADLCLTQSALSRQVQALEERLGVKLLLRGHRAISFTPEGERLFRSANSAVQQLQDAFAVVSAGARRKPVTLSASIGVTGLWILPGLGRFQMQHPHIDVRVAANNRLLELAGEDIDLAIRYGSLATAPGTAKLLFKETITPVAHPSLGAQHLISADDIRAHVLLEFDDPAHPWLRWRDWLAQAGMTDVRPRGILHFNQYDQVVHSAMAGQGIALGRLALLQPMLKDQRLVQLDTPHQGYPHDHAYWLIQAESAPRAEVQALIDWIIEEAAQ